MKNKFNARGISEDQLEASITEYLAMVLPNDCVAFHIPNAGKRKARAVAEMKRAGMLTGMPDRGIVYQGKAFFLEAKRPYIKGVQRPGMLSRTQEDTHHALRAAGSDIATVRTIEEVESALIGFGIPLKQGVFL